MTLQLQTRVLLIIISPASMKERLAHIGTKSADVSKRVLTSAKDCLSDAQHTVIPMIPAATGAYSLAQEQYAVAALNCAVTSVFLYLNHYYMRQRDELNRLIGFRQGERRSLPIGIMRLDLTLPTDKPLYTSLDEATVINDPLKLLASIGGNPGQATTQMGIILEHSEKRALRREEIETLRKMQAMRKLVPGFEETLCEEGKQSLRRMDKIIEDYAKDQTNKTP